MILGIDSYSEQLGLSLVKDHKVIYSIGLSKFKPFSEAIILKLDEMFKELELDKSLLKKIVVNKGPGSYTGLRVGITVAKVLSYALEIDIYSYKSLDVMAYKHRCFDGNIICGINAGKGELYFREYISKDFNIEPVSDISIQKQKDFQENFKNKKNTLFVFKNLEMEGINAFQILEPLTVEGIFYSLRKDLKENPFQIEPVYIRTT